MKIIIFSLQIPKGLYMSIQHLKQLVYHILRISIHSGF